MFNRTIDEVMFKPQTSDMMIQLQRFLKVNPLRNMLDEKEKALFTRKSAAVDNLRHLQGLLAWSCNSVSTAESNKVVSSKDNQDSKPDAQCSVQPTMGISKRRLQPCLARTRKARKSEVIPANCSPPKLEKCQFRTKISRLFLSDGSTFSNCEIRTNRKSTEEVKAESTRKLEYPQEQVLLANLDKVPEPITNPEVVASRKPIVNQRLLKKTSMLPVLESRYSPVKQQQSLQDRKYTTPEMIPLSPPPKLPKGYLRFDSNCIGLLTANMPLLPGKKYERCKNLQLPPLTAERICVIDSETLELVLSRSPDDNEDPIQIASLTKILTALLTILACAKFGVDIKQYKCRVSEEGASMPGTSAQLQVGDMLTIESLLYGLMLPSGNDSSVTLAEGIGRIILKNRKRPTKLTPYKLFVGHMNMLYQEVIKESNLPNETVFDSEDEEPCHRFQNPSGLSYSKNTTKPEQIMLLAAVAHRNPIFREIVSTKEYTVSIRNERYGLDRRLSWRNTNKLLAKGWQGTKTGTTENAGPCLIGKIENYLIGVFNCGGHQKRFNQALLIYDTLRKTL